MRLAPLVPLAAAVALLAAGCGGGGTHVPKAEAATQPVGCTHPLGWQRLANRIHASVYCPNWLPDPLIGQIGGRWNNIDSVGKDRSYLISFVWQDTDGPNTTGELHVNLRGYPGRTKIPMCQETLVGSGKPRYQEIPCFADPQGQRTINGIRFTEYTVNQDADQWHLLYLWRHDGGLYTISEHVAPPLTFGHVKQYLDKILGNLVVVDPQG